MNEVIVRHDQQPCNRGLHDYLLIGQSGGLMVRDVEGHELITAFCRRCGDVRVVDLSAHDTPEMIAHRVAITE